MKKYFSLLLAASVIGLASCGDNESSTTTEQVDSMANYRTDTMEAALKAKNDSLINEMARMKADSAMRAEEMAAGRSSTGGASASSGGARTTKPKTTKPTTPANPSTPSTRQEDKFNSRVNNGETPISKEKAKEQEDKFNRR